MQCDGCKRPHSTDMKTYCVPTQTKYGNLCHLCREENKESLELTGSARYMTAEQWKERAEENRQQFAEMIQHADEVLGLRPEKSK